MRAVKLGGARPVMTSSNSESRIGSWSSVSIVDYSTPDSRSTNHLPGKKRSGCAAGDFAIHALAQLLFGSLHQVFRAMFSNIKCRGDLQSRVLAAETHLQRQPRSVGQQSKTISQVGQHRFSVVVSHPAGPFLVKLLNVFHGSHAARPPLVRNEQVECGLSQVRIRRSRADVVERALQDRYERVLRQIIGERSLAAHRSQITPNAGLIRLDQPSRIKPDGLWLARWVHFPISRTASR